MILMSAVFFLIAAIYSSVGFGGGSSYIAVLALLSYPYQSIPTLALFCNLIVVSSSAYHFYQGDHFSWRQFWPYAVTSIPMAFWGGQIHISETLFLSLLGLCLFLVALRLLIWNRLGTPSYEESFEPKIGVALMLGATLGFLSGVVGIGGGIFLAPVLLYLRWGRPKQIAATAAFFILLNSFAGLSGQLLKGDMNMDIFNFWPLFLSVFLGGQLGSRMGSSPRISQRAVKDATAFLVLFVAFRILLVSARQ